MAFSFAFERPPTEDAYISALLAAASPQWPTAISEPEPAGPMGMLPPEPVGPIYPSMAEPLPAGPTNDFTTAAMPNLRRMVTGASERFVDVPSIMATNAAQFRPQPQFQAAPIRRPELPPIFETLQSLEQAASQVTGYNPQNPPSIPAITESQFMSMSPLLRKQYLGELRRRSKIIEDGRRRQVELANVAIQTELAKRRKATEDAEVAKEDLTAAANAKKAADRAYEQASRKLAAHQAEVNKAAAKGWVSFDPRRKAWISNGRHNDLVAETFNSDRPEIDRANEAAMIAKDEADRAYLAAQTRASRSGLSTQAGLPPIMQQSNALNVRLNPATGRFEIAR